MVDLGAAAVVDVSRGSGMAARAALDLGLHYFGVARNSYHAGWLNIVVDRAAVLGVIDRSSVRVLGVIVFQAGQHSPPLES